MARFRWFGMRFFPLLSLGLATTAGASPSNEGVVLRPFQSGYPDETMIYEGEEARRLAREILPVAVDRLARVIVHESIMLPGGMYYGLSMEFELAPRVIAQTLCEQQLMIVSMTPDNRSVPRGEVRLLRAMAGSRVTTSTITTSAVGSGASNPTIAGRPRHWRKLAAD